MSRALSVVALSLSSRAFARARFSLVTRLARFSRITRLAHFAPITRLVLLFPLCVACASAASAANSFDDYRARVNVALNHATDLYDALEDKDARASETRAAQSLAAVRATLPPKERVEWAGVAIEVDNSWLHKELEAYRALAAGETSKRKEVVSRIVARLGALNRQLDETARMSLQSRDKEAEKGRLQTILRRPEYNEQASRGGAIQQVWNWIKELLRNLIPDSKPMAPGAARVLSLIARIFVYALAVAVVVFVLWRFAPALWTRFATRRKRRARRAACARRVCRRSHQ
jgi:hypothetical protein